MVMLLNRGARTWDLKDGKDKDGKPVKRKLPPNGSIEALDEHEAKTMLGYHEIVDAEKAMPAVGDKMKALQDEVSRLQAELADARKRLEKYEPPKTDKDEDEAKGKGKGK